MKDLVDFYKNYVQELNIIQAEIQELMEEHSEENGDSRRARCVFLVGERHAHTTHSK